jgi:5-oxoprolinase (ATP-hydrolysing)
MTTLTTIPPLEDAADGKFHFSIDRGGTFTDVFCILPSGKEVVSKLLSEDPSHYADAPTEGIRRVLQEYDIDTSDGDNQGRDYTRGKLVDTSMIGSIRMGTTVATNALLERDGEPMAFLTTKGFADILEIGNQSRPDIFDLSCAKASLLYNRVVEVQERIVLKQFTPELWKGKYEEHTGITGETVLVVQEPDLVAVRKQLEELRDAGITALAVCLMHAYVYSAHEELIGKVAEEMGCFDQISLSHQVMAMVKLVSRGHTTSAAAYLTPKITLYLANFQAGFDTNLQKVPLTFMKSDGGLAPVTDFGGHQAILSGPAGGVVGYAKTAYKPGVPVIGFDMGGTSTDVSRYDGSWELVFETVTAGVAIQAPQLDIHTVAAGGGSRLFLKRGMFVVGPESARAHPGPVCYKKNGYLAVTDANVILGRVVPEHFPCIFGPNEDEPLDIAGAREAFAALTKLPEAAGRSAEELAYGFLQVANEAMCRPIRNLTQYVTFIRLAGCLTVLLLCFMIMVWLLLLSQ